MVAQAEKLRERQSRGRNRLGRSPTRDPHHGQSAEIEFHPVSTTSNTDEQIKDSIRDFANNYSGEWRWSLGGEDCHAFQQDLLRAALLSEPGA
jgi:hypothetical protein